MCRGPVAAIQKAAMIYEEGRTDHRPRVTDERG